VVLAVLALPVTAVATPLLGHVFGRQYVVSAWHITELMVTSVLAPLVAGMTIRVRRPELAERIAGPIERVQRSWSPLGMCWVGPDPRYSAVLAFATSCRDPAAALTVAAANFPEADEYGAVALYGLVTAAIGALYTRWLRRRSVLACRCRRGTPRPASPTSGPTHFGGGASGSARISLPSQFSRRLPGRQGSGVFPAPMNDKKLSWRTRGRE
jgi:predicted Na+-dependent transporter